METNQGSLELHGLDTDKQVFFYEQDFYVLSNFSSFQVHWQGKDFQTTEHAYHWSKFFDVPGAYNEEGPFARQVAEARSAHDSFTLAQRFRAYRRADWDAVKEDIMRNLLRAKVSQHEYVKRKLLATGNRELVENSWRDDYWGWGPNRDGLNRLGVLWMEVRQEVRRMERHAESIRDEEE